MGSGVILIKSFVADYCNNSNRHQEKTIPEAIFLFIGSLNRIPKRPVIIVLEEA